MANKEYKKENYPEGTSRKQVLDDMIDHIVMRTLDQFDITRELVDRWDGEMHNNTKRILPIK